MTEKNKNNEMLTLHLGDPGTVFQVNEAIKDNTFTPGTKGYLSYIQGPDHNNPNIVFQIVVTTRKGRTGKPRLNKNILLTPIFSIPGIPVDKIIPMDSARKSFVSIDLENIVVDLLDCNAVNMQDFLGAILSRAAFAMELDNVSYTIDTPIAKYLGITGNSKVNFFKKGGADTLRVLVNEAESMHEHDNLSGIHDLFTSKEARPDVAERLHLVETSLVIPKLEYNRRVMGVLNSALKHVKSVVDGSSEIKDLPNIADIRKMIENTETFLDARGKEVSNLLNKRLSIMKETRQLLKM